ncbi:MAG: hypothetical protein BJ554DRAFT_1207, partial [Olpidium bornovanus]
EIRKNSKVFYRFWRPRHHQRPDFPYNRRVPAWAMARALVAKARAAARAAEPGRVPATAVTQVAAANRPISATSARAGESAGCCGVCVAASEAAGKADRKRETVHRGRSAGVMPPSHLFKQPAGPVQPLPAPRAAPPDVCLTEEGEEDEEDEEDDDEFASASEWDGDEKKVDGEQQEDAGGGCGGQGLRRNGPGARDTTAEPEAADSGPALDTPLSQAAAAAAAGGDRRTAPDSGTGGRRGASSAATATTSGTGTEPIVGRSSAALAAASKKPKKTADVQPTAADMSPGEQAGGGEKNATPTPSDAPAHEAKSPGTLRVESVATVGTWRIPIWTAWLTRPARSVCSLETAVKPLRLVAVVFCLLRTILAGGNLRAAAARTVDNVYEALDPEYGKEKEVMRSAAKVGSPPASASELKEGPDDAPKSAGSASSPIREHASDVTAEVKVGWFFHNLATGEQLQSCVLMHLKTV